MIRRYQILAEKANPPFQTGGGYPGKKQWMFPSLPTRPGSRSHNIVAVQMTDQDQSKGLFRIWQKWVHELLIWFKNLRVQHREPNYIEIGWNRRNLDDFPNLIHLDRQI
jgi:hypothetical protein